MQSESRAVVKAYVKNGMLASVAVGTGPLEFTYSYYEEDKAVNLYILRRFNETHKRMVQAYVEPETAQKLIEAFFTPPKKDENKTEDAWKHIYTVVETITGNVAKVATVRIGDDVTFKARGMSLSFGYRQEYPDKYYVYADAEWVQEKYSCRAYESDYVEDIKQSLMYFVGNVLDFVSVCPKS